MIKVNNIKIGDTIIISFIASRGYHASTVDDCIKMAKEDGYEYYAINPDSSQNLKVFALEQKKQ